MELNLKKNEKLTKIITVILAGVLILIAFFPIKNSMDEDSSADNSGNTYEDEYSYYAEYYENKLKSILEESYGEGTMQVMVRVAMNSEDSSFYGDSDNKVVVEGVLVVANVNDEAALSDISFAVCALFDLPVHKVAVMIKN